MNVNWNMALHDDRYESAIGEEANRLVNGSRNNPDETFSGINR